MYERCVGLAELDNVYIECNVLTSDKCIGTTLMSSVRPVVDRRAHVAARGEVQMARAAGSQIAEPFRHREILRQDGRAAPTRRR